MLLFDAVDSGLSVDSIMEMKEVFNLILQDTKEFSVKVYIIISANEYEPLIAQIKGKAENEERELNWRERDKIREYKRIIKGD